MKASILSSSIILTKAQAKRAENIKSKTYNQLAELMSRFPGFTITVEDSKKNNAQNCVTIDFMDKYIESHEDKDSDIKKEFSILSNPPEGEKVNFLELKHWFFSYYPECNGKHTDKSIEDILASARKRARNSKAVKV